MNSQETNNVHVLPRNMDESHLKNAEDTIQYMKEVRKEFADEVVDFTVEQTISCMRQFGALNDGNRCKTQDFLMLENAVAAILYRYYNLEHALHPISDDIFIMEDEDELDEENADFIFTPEDTQAE